jgi:hypothetical protein
MMWGSVFVTWLNNVKRNKARGSRKTGVCPPKFEGKRGDFE